MVVIGSRIDENLLLYGKFTTVARQKGNRSSEISTGGVTDQCDGLKRNSQHLWVSVEFKSSGIAILQPCREGGLRCKAVLHRGHIAAGAFCHIPTYMVVGVHTLHDPAAAMEEQQQIWPGMTGRSIETDPDLMAIPQQPMIPMAIQRCQRSTELPNHSLHFITFIHVQCRRVAQCSQSSRAVLLIAI